MSVSRRPRLLPRIVLLVLLPLVPLLAFTVYSGLDKRREAAAEAGRSALRLAKAVSASQAQLIEEARQLVTTLAKDPRLRRDDPSACNLYLADTLHRWPHYANLGVIEPSGEITCSAIPFSPGVNASDRLYFQEAVSTRDFAVGEYQIGRITGKATLNFGYPLLDAGGRVTSVVFAALDLSWLNDLARDAKLDPGTTIVVLDRKGTILARYPDPKRWVGRLERRDAVVAAVLEGEEGTGEVPGLDGVNRFYGFTPLPRGARATPVYITAGLPSSRALAPAQQELERNLVAVALIALFAGLVGWFGGGLLVERPVRRNEQELGARAEAVAHFGEHLAHADENGGLASTVLTDLADALEADVGALYVMGKGGALSLAAVRGLDRASLAARMAPGEGRAGRAFAEGRPVVASPDSSALRLVTLGGELPVRHELYLPLADGDRPLGVVALGRTGELPFAADELELLGHLAAQAGAALSQAGELSAASRR